MADIPTDTGNYRRGNNTDNGQEPPPGVGLSIRLGVPRPEKVLVVAMSDGSYLLVGYPQGEPAAFMARENADLLRWGFAGAFGSHADEADRENGGSNGTVVPGNGASRPQQVQP